MQLQPFFRNNILSPVLFFFGDKFNIFAVVVQAWGMLLCFVFILAFKKKMLSAMCGGARL